MKSLDFLILFLLLSSCCLLASNADEHKIIDAQMHAEIESPNDGKVYKIMREGPSPGDGN